MGVTRVVTTLVKLAFALAVLAVGWMMLSPGSTASWPLSRLVQAGLAALAKTFPVEPKAWAVVVLLFGGASLLAALPKSAKARSRPRPHGDPSIPVLEVNAPVDAEAAVATAPLPEPVPDTASIVEPAPEPVLVAESLPEPPREPVAPTEAAPLSLDEEEQAARQALSVSGETVARSRLADLLKKRGDIAESEGRLDDAMSAYEESVALRREVLAPASEDAREQRWLWTTLESLAECREDRGHRTRAAALFRESVSAGIRAVALAPQKSHYPQELEETRARLAALEAQLAL